MNVIAKPTLLPWAPENTGESNAAPAAPPARARGPGLFAYFLLPTRLAWRQLRAERARLFSAMAGVMFAAVLVFFHMAG